MSSPSTGAQSRIILTGSTGYLGKNILKNVLAQGYSVTCLVRNNFGGTDAETVQVVDISKKNWTEKVKPAETLIHCATSYGRKGETPQEVAKANLDFPRELLAHCPHWQVKTWINTHTALPANLNLYAQTKAEWLETLKNSSIATKLNLVLEQFYGPGEDPTQFVTWLARHLLTTRDEIPLTAGEQRRNFIYIDDLVGVYNQSLRQPFPAGFHEFHIASVEASSIRDLATMVAVQCGQNLNRLKFGAIAYRANELMKSDVGLRLPAFPNWQAQISLSEGVRRVVEFEKLRLESLSKNQ